jgi:TorA maturation chaperone TorD
MDSRHLQVQSLGIKPFGIFADKNASALRSRHIGSLFYLYIKMSHLTQTVGVHPLNRPPIQHDDLSMPLTLAQQTKIQMPMLDEETTFTALFVLDDSVPISARRNPGRRS